MSTEKGELVGITEDGIEMVYVAGFETEWAKSGMMSVADQMGKVAVALAAQKAMAEEIAALIDPMQDTLTKKWYVEIEQEKWDELCAKLGVK